MPEQVPAIGPTGAMGRAVVRAQLSDGQNERLVEAFTWDPMLDGA